MRAPDTRRRRRTAPSGAPWDERAALLGDRLGLPMPVNGTATMMIRWWAMIGMRLAEDQPEFSKRKLGRHPGSGNKRLDPNPSTDTLRKRAERTAFVKIGLMRMPRLRDFRRT